MIKAVVLFALVAVAFAAESTENKDLTSANTFGLGYAGAYGYGPGLIGTHAGLLESRFGLGRGLGVWDHPAIGAYPYVHGAYPYVGGVYPRGSRSLLSGVGYPGYLGYTPYAGVAPAPYAPYAPAPYVY